MIKTTNQILAELDAIAKQRKITRPKMALAVGVPFNTLKKWFEKGTTKRNPSLESLQRLQIYLQSLQEEKTADQMILHTPSSSTSERTPIKALEKEAKTRTRNIRYLLVLLEDQLRWFRDGSPDFRDILRKNLDSSDIGYITSLLTMMTDESRFNRWLKLTTTRFNSFKKQ